MYDFPTLLTACSSVASSKDRLPAVSSGKRSDSVPGVYVFAKCEYLGCFGF